MDTETLVIEDLDTNTTYKLQVDAESLERAKTDTIFATELLETFKETQNLQQDQEEIAFVTGEFLGAFSKQTTEWTREETLALIEAYEIHKEQFMHLKKRKMVWTNIASYLQSNGFSKNAKSIEIKWNNPVHTYKTIKDHNGRTGKGGISRFQFIKEMDEVLGDKPLISNNHTVAVGLNTNDRVLATDNSDAAQTEEVLSETEKDSSEETQKEKNIKEKPLEPKDKSKEGSGSTNTNNLLTLKKSYLKQKINDKDLRIKEIHEYMEFLKKEKRMKREREERKLKLKEKALEIEEKRLEILEKYLQTIRLNLL